MKTVFTFFALLLFTITTVQAQVISYPGTTASICAGGQILLTATNPPIPTGSFVWEKSIDGITAWASVGFNSNTHTATSGGFYRVTVLGPPIFVYPTLQIIEYPNPVAGFTFTPNAQCGTVPVVFNNTSLAGTSYLWNFNDGPSGLNNTSTLANPTHQFIGLPGNATQIFTVALTTYNAQGCENITSELVTINQLPDATLNGTGYSFTNGVHSFKKCANSGTDNFNFNNGSTTIATNTFYQIIWGDGTPDFIATSLPTSQILSHTFSQGTTNMQFIVTGANGCKDTTAYSVFLGSNPAVGFGNPGNTAICSSSTLTFPISNTATNTNGTTYTVTFNDGTPPINFTHPPPASISHTFLNTSCGTNSPPNFPNSFSATILATNPCAQSLATVVPIYVSQKPVPSFSTSPNDTICLSNLLDVTNTSGLNSSNDNGSCTPGKVVWSITPATGWVLNAGNFGTLNGTLDPAFWTSGTQNLNFSFTAVGTYTIKMIIGNTFCGIDSMIRTVCVNPIPTAAFDINNTTGCTPLNVNTTNLSNSPYCGTNKYNWVVSYTATAGCAATTANYTYINNTSSTDANPQFQFINAGVYSIGLQTTSPGGTCTSTLVSKVVVVKDKPAVSINALPPICENQTATPIANMGCYITGATNYLWTFAGATPTTSTNAIPGNITYNNAGSYVVQLKVTNECGATDAAQNIAVGLQPNFVAPPNYTVCAEQNVPAYIFASTPAGATFSWSNTNSSIGLAASGVGAIPTFVATNSTNVAQVATLNITASNGSCVRVKSFTITVYPKPLTPQANTPIAYCKDATALPIIVSALAGHTLLWYTNAIGGIGSVTAPTPITTATGTFTYYVSQVSTSTFGCEGPRAAISVLVKPTPVISATSASPTSCTINNGSITITGLLGNTSYIIQYLLNGTAVSSNILTNSNGVYQLSNLAAGTYSNVYVVLNSCPSNIVGPYILLSPTPPVVPLATTNGPLCEGSTLQLSANTTTAGIATYSWTGPSGFTSALQYPTIANITMANAGQYTVSVTINSCTSGSSPVSFVVRPAAGLPTVASPISYCLGITTTALTAVASTGNTLQWYANAVGGTSLSSAPVPSASSVGNTTYYVGQTTALGCTGLRAPLLVQINPNARALFAPTDTVDCAPFVITPAIVGLQQFPQLNNTYQWYANNVLIGAGIVFPTYTISNPNDSVTIKLKATSIFGCKADSFSFQFNTFKIPEPSFTQSLNIGCGALQVSFTNTTPLINTYNYTWNFGNGITSNAQQPIPITFAPNPTYNDTTYTIRLSVSSVCNTILFERPITVKSKPKALFTPDRTTGCSPMRVLFTNTSKGVNNTYYWEFDDGTATFVTTDIAAFFRTFNTGVVRNYTIRLIATNECGSDTAVRVLTVAPNNIQLLYAINGPDRYGCAPHTVAFFNSSTGASSFQWNFGDGNTLATTLNVQTVYHTYQTAGEYTVSLTAANNCTDTFALKQITVYPKPTAAFSTSTTAACIGQSVQMINTSSSGTSYLWHFGDNTTSTLANPQHTYTTASITPYIIKLIIYRLNPSGNICTDTTTRQITVADTLVGNFNLSATTGTCAPLTVNFTNLILPSVTAIWSFGDGTIGTGNNPSHTYTQAGNFTVLLTVTVAGGCTYTKSTTVTLAGPTGTFNYAGGFRCYNSPVSFAANAANTTQYIWNFGDGVQQTTTTNVVTHNYANPGSYTPTVSLQNAGGCIIPIQGLAPVKVDKLTKGFAHSQALNCGSSTVYFTDTSFAFFGKAQVKWQFGDGAEGQGGIINHTYIAPGYYTVKMIVLGNSGCTDTTIKTVLIQLNSAPIAAIIAPQAGCAKDAIVFTSVVQSASPLNPLVWKIMPANIIVIGNNLNYVFGLAGTYQVQLIANTTAGCNDTALHSIVIHPSPNVQASNNANVCLGNTLQLTSTGADTYLWSPTNALTCSTCPSPIATPTNSTAYTVLGVNAFGCTNIDTVNIAVIQPTLINASPSVQICQGQSVNLLATGANNYSWNNGATLNNNAIANPTATPTVTTSYRVIGYDGYNCFADTAFVLVAVGKIPTVKLGNDVVLATGTQLTLQSTTTNGPIAQWSWTPSANLSCANCPAPIANIKKEITYTVKVTTAFGCTATDAITIKTFCQSTQVFIPNAFTPDNDGINDVLIVRGKGIASVKYFRIFNRWGELIFERNNFAANDVKFAWDGKIRGVVGPPDVFVYVAEVICESGETYVYKGNTSSLK